MYGSERGTETLWAGAGRTGGEGTTRTRHDPEEGSRLSTTLAHALADTMGVDVTEAERALAERIDPRSLDLLFRGDEEPAGHVALGVRGYRTTVYSDGRIVIDPPAPR